MDDLFVGIGIALVLEGALYTLMPDGMKRLMSAAIQQSSGALRSAVWRSPLSGLGSSRLCVAELEKATLVAVAQRHILEPIERRKLDA